jgi:antitoxin (DNA-binding transcriptional repressor) of toxin-antitoxin stability system
MNENVPIKPYLLADAQTHLQELIEKAAQGQAIFIQGDHQTIVQLVPLASAPQPRKAGSARGLVLMADDFDAPLADFDDYCP